MLKTSLLVILFISNNILGMQPKEYFQEAYKRLEWGELRILSIVLHNVSIDETQKYTVGSANYAQFIFGHGLISIKIPGKKSTTITLPTFKSYYQEVTLENALFENDVFSEKDVQKVERELHKKTSKLK